MREFEYFYTIQPSKTITTMAGINKAILVGNLGRDPEVRTLENGASVAQFTLATSESYKNKNGERVENTEWHNIVVWRGLAEIAGKYLKKGSKVYLEGKITSRSWDDKESGQKRYITEIVADNMVMLDSKGSDNNAGGYSPSASNESPSSAASSANEPVDDLPF